MNVSAYSSPKSLARWIASPEKENKNPRLNFLSSHESVSTIFPETPLNKTFKGYWRSINMEKSIIKNEIDVYHGLSNEIPRIKSHNKGSLYFHQSHGVDD